jgi:hypothetical protein
MLVWFKLCHVDKDLAKEAQVLVVCPLKQLRNI